MNSGDRNRIGRLTENKAWIAVPRTEAENKLTIKFCIQSAKKQKTTDGKYGRKYRARLVSRVFIKKRHRLPKKRMPLLSNELPYACCFEIVAHFDLPRHKVDVKTAFLNGDIDQDGYTEQPEGCVDPKKPDFDCKLQKALYSLKQAPRQWYANINRFLAETVNFYYSPHDPCSTFATKTGSRR